MSDNVLPLRLPVLEAARRLFSHVVAVHEYRDATGALVYARARRTTAPKVLPMHRTDAGEWVRGEPQWPGRKKMLYRLDAIASSNGPVWIVEGEKCADVLTRLGLTATTSGSSSSARTADWTPLQGRAIRVWPDNDDAGRRYALDVAARLKALCCSVEILALDGLCLAIKEDCADWLQRHPRAKSDDIEALPRVLPGELPAKAETPDPPLEAGIIELPDGRLAITSDTARFVVGRAGVFFERFTPDRQLPERFKVCSEIRVLAKTRTADSSAWGLLLEWRDPDGVLKRWACPRELLIGDAQALRRELASNGLEFGTSRRGVERFEEFLASWPVKDRAICVDKIGWCQDAFVTPAKVFSRADSETVVFQSTGSTRPMFAKGGTLDGWRAHVASLAAGNSRLVFAIAAAFAGPLLRFQSSGGDSGGFNLRGTSSSGKTTALRAAASVYGGTGFVRQWRATANGLEATAEAHNDCLLILDELAQIDPGVAGECAYLLGNGTGKNRMTKSLSAPPPKEWRLLFLSAGELSLSEHMLEAGKRAKAGQELRLADLPADAGAGMGVVESLHGHADPGALVNHIRDATARHFGHAGEAWLEWLVRQDGLSARVDAFLKRWACETATICPSGKAARVLARFGLVAAAGELATEAGITGWPPGESWRACLDCARAWWGAQEWLIQRDEDRVLDHIRAIIEQQSARFSDWHADEAQNRIPNRLGFRRQIGGSGQFDLDRFEWLVFRSAWRADICRGLDPNHVERVLIAAGVLIPDRHAKPTQAIRSPIGVQRFYVLSHALFEGETSSP